MNAAILALLTVLAQIAPALSTSASLSKIIDLLVQLIPTLVKAIEDVVPFIKNIIDALRGNSVITPEQLVSLDDLEAKIDAEFEAAAAMPDDEGMPQ